MSTTTDFASDTSSLFTYPSSDSYSYNDPSSTNPYTNPYYYQQQPQHQHQQQQQQHPQQQYELNNNYSSPPPLPAETLTAYNVQSPSSNSSYNAGLSSASSPMSRGMFYGSPSESTELSSAQGGMAVATMNESDDNQLIVPFNPEICYITDETGAILSLEDKIWNQFLADNCPIPLPAHIQRCTFPTILGKNLFEFIGDQKVQTFFRHIIYMLIAGMQDRYTYHWYCDSPEMERKMSMTVCKMTFLDNRQLILWCSKIIHEKKLSPPQKYISSPPEPITAEELMVGKPKRTVCSYCKRILVSADDLNPPAVQHVLQNMCKITGPLFDDGITPIIGLRGKLGQHVESQDGNPSTHLWLTPKQYYHMFRLDDEIVINHGVCEVCFQEIALLFFPPGSFKNGASTQNY